MRAILVSLFLTILTGSSFAQFSFSAKGTKVTFEETNSDDFEALTIGDTTYLSLLTYSGLDGKKILFSENVNSIKIKYELGFLQYTNDDNPAGPLDFRTWSNTTELSGNLLPDFYGNNINAELAHIILGHDSKSLLANKVFTQNFKAIWEESIQTQKKFFNLIVNDSKYSNCCPEYIEQANNFLESNYEEKRTIEDLHLEFGYLTTIIEAKLEASTGESKKLIMVLK